MPGPLAGLKIVEMAAIGPAPFCGMMLADMGAEVVRIDRPPTESNPQDNRFNILERGKRSIDIDLKQPGGQDAALQLIDKADAVIEGYRPGVMERLGLGPDICLKRNPRLVYGRMTGWGQFGPLSHSAGHDINYIALSGALHAIGRPGEPPVVPLNYIGDFGGGGMLLLCGILCALRERDQSGLGQVVDAAMTDGSALLSAMMYGFLADGSLTNKRGENLLDGGAHFYNTYACADGKYISIGAIEPQFYVTLIRLCGIDDPAFDAQRNEYAWPVLRYRLADIFKTKARHEWCALLEGTDACFAPVLDWEEASRHPHNQCRETFLNLDGIVQPAPAPRFSRTPAAVPKAPQIPGQDAVAILRDWGVCLGVADRIKAVGQPD